MKNRTSYNYPNVQSAKLIALCVVLLMCTATISRAQLNPFQSMYFQNKYQYNPSMAGMDNALNLFAGYKQQWSGFPGTPKSTAFTADYKVENVGVGLNVTDDQEGLIRQTRIMGTYAYHLPIGANNQKLNFGISAGVNDARIDYSKVSGDVSDAQIADYNQLKAYVDGDFGVSYTNNRLYVGGALPNLKAVFFGSSDQRFDADRLLFMLAANYKIPLNAGDGAYTVESVGAIRVVKGYDNIYDVGASFVMNKYGLYLQSLYHSSENMGFSVGLDQSAYALNFTYNLETGKISAYTNGTFEFGLKVRLFKKTSAN